MDGDLEKEDTDGCCRTFWKDVQRYWVNDGTKTVLVILYLLGNAALFMERFYHYYWGGGKRYYELYGFGIPFARGAAAALKLNCACVLIPVLRNFLCWLRGTWVNNVVPIDKAIIFHKGIALLIWFWSTIHIVAHMFNWFVLWNTDVTFINGVLGTNLLSNPSPYRSAFLTLAGSTGHATVLVMVLMYTSAFESLRRPFFEVFWYTHHLAVFFYGLLIVHGLRGILERATFWMWVCGPILLYLIERGIRIYRGFKPVTLVKAIQHPSRVIELQLQIPGFEFKPGQWMFINMPFLAPHEWHPFTISSAPRDEHVTCHIRVVGDWTGKLSRALNPNKMKEGVIQENIRFASNGAPILCVDGPFGAASEDVYDYAYVMLVAGGIGVTPFASILKAIRHALARNNNELTLKKVYFYWIARDRTCFEWFQALLAEIEQSGQSHIFEINIYFTGEVKSNEIKQIMLNEHDAEQPDFLTGLQARTNYKRPEWKHIFQDMKQKHPGQTIGVFLCGPPLLSKQLYKNCSKFSTGKRGETQFKFKKENF